MPRRLQLDHFINSKTHDMKRLHTACDLIFKYLQSMTYLQCVNCLIPAGKKKENPPTGLYSQSYSVNLLGCTLADSVEPFLVQDPAPKFPALSAISNELFRF